MRSDTSSSTAFGEPTVEQDAAHFLTGDSGRAVLQRAASLKGDVATRLLALHGKELPEIARLAVEIVVARERAKRRGFADADRLFFTEDALAQATSPTLAAYRASCLARFHTVADLCCGAGVDAIALAEAGADVIAVDIDPVRLIFARANAEIRGVADRILFLNEPVEALGWATTAQSAFFDPARRLTSEGGGDIRRVSRHGDRYAPPLDFLQTVREHVRGGCAKLSPALPDDVLRELAPSRVEFLSENRECKEACVWFGEAVGASGAGDEFAAVLLGDGLAPWSLGVRALSPPAPLSLRRERGASRAGVATLLEVRHAPANRLPLLPSEGEGGGGREGTHAKGTNSYLLDPDPAIIRAGEMDKLCLLTNAVLAAPDDAYLLTDTLPTGQLARAASAYRVLATMPYAPKKVSAWLRANNYGRIVLKKRHYPSEPDAVARELGVSVRGAGREVTLVLARDAAKRFLAVLCEPV